jgi:hypothetical protein
MVSKFSRSVISHEDQAHRDFPLAAFRIFRLLLKQGNPNSHSQVMKHDILKPILDLTLKESLRDNLLSCSCQEYFEHMRKVRNLYPAFIIPFINADHINSDI